MTATTYSRVAELHQSPGVSPLHVIAVTDADHMVGVVEALEVPMIAECAEAVIGSLDAASVAASALVDGFVAGASSECDGAHRSAMHQTPVPTKPAEKYHGGGPRCHPGVRSTSEVQPGVVRLDEYVRAVLYNGLGHYQAARNAASKACAGDDFQLLDGALAELVEASVRSGCHDGALAAMARLERRRSAASESKWAMGIRMCARALLSGDDAERRFVEAIDLLSGAGARVSLGRAHLLYGEWLRRRGRRVDARANLRFAHQVFCDVGLSGFADRAYRELLATGSAVRKRTDDTRFDLTDRELQIARLAAARCTNPEIGEQLFLSSRTVEWHLRKIFSKLGISSRKELKAIFEPTARTSL
jgi:DNA-binding CsgD family transcriptional regulator